MGEPSYERDHTGQDAMDEYETSSRTVVVEGITEGVDVEMVELFFESSKKSGGGPLEKLDMQEKTGRAILMFEHKEHADRILSNKQFTIADCEVTVHPYTDLTTKTSKPNTDDQHISTTNEKDIVIRVSGITSNMSEEMLQLFFEHQRQSGGGEIKDMEVDFGKGEAFLSYVDSEVAERVLSRETFNFQKTQMSVSKADNPKWDKKTVLVTGFGTMTEETLELLYEHKKKSGGGPIERLSMLEKNAAALVTFINKADAARVLHQGFVKQLDGSVISACKPMDMSTEAAGSGGAPLTNSEPTPSVLPTSIMVLGIDENVTEEGLEMLFENKSKSGGGPVEKVTIDPEFGMASVTFVEAKVAQRVLAKGSVKLQNLNLILHPHIPKTVPLPEGAEGGANLPEEMEQSGYTSGEELASTSKSVQLNCIEVSGLPRDTTEEYLGLFLESERHGGGGEIENVTRNWENGTAVIVFKEESTTKKILQKHDRCSLVIDGCKLQIKAIDTSLFGGMIPTNKSCAIQVTGLPVNASDESVQLFFENKRMSGGESLQDIVHYPVEGKAVLTYATPEVAQRVIDKHQAKPIHFEGSLLQIKKLYSTSRLAQIVGPKEDNILFLQNVNEEASADDIRYYLELVPKCKVSHCVFGLKEGTVLVYFVFMPGFEKFYALSCRKPLRGSMVDVEIVARSKSIEVYGVDKLSVQKLQMYFEHPKSKGGDVNCVDMLAEERCAIVTFVKYGVAESVLSQTDHTFEKCQLIVKLHHECIGILPPHHDHTSPGGMHPQPVVDKCDPHILAFILNTPSNKKYIEERMATVCGRIKWPDQITENVQVEIECTLQRHMPGFTTKVKTWSADVEGRFVSILSDFTRDEINVSQEGWKEFLKVTGELKPQTPDDLEVTVNQDMCTVAAVGKRNIVEHFMDRLRQWRVDNARQEELESPSRSGRFNCIEVSGLPRDTTEEFVRIFFESGHQSGEIESVTTDLENRKAVIVFKEESTTEKLLGKHSKSPLVIEGCKLQIKVTDRCLYGGMIPADTSCAIQVTGLPVNASDESVMMFFENRKMSGGESLEDIVHYPAEGKAVLTYATPEVAQRVRDKHQAKPIHFEGSVLQIKMLYSNSSLNQIVGPKEANTLFLQNVNESASADDIHYYLELIPKCQVSHCVFGLKEGTVLVYFVFMPGFEKFYELTCQKPLRGSMVDVESVARSRSIEVYGVETLSGQKLQMYFEHPKSKGGDVDSVDMLAEEQCAIVTFVKYGVAESVLSKTDHTFERCQLIVKLHNECIGILPPHHDHTSPGACIPSTCVINKCDPHILGFILKTPSNRKYVEDGIAAVFGRVKWPDQITDDVQVQINCTLQKNLPELTAKVKTWSADVKERFVSILSDFTRDEINMLQEGWKEFLKVTGELKPQISKDVEVTVNQDTCTVAAVGKRNIVEQFMDRMRQASANVEEKLQRQCQIITDTVHNLKDYQIQFLLAHKFSQNTKQTFQDMTIEADLEQSTVVFTGVLSDIISAKLQMYELVNQMRYDKLTFSRLVCALLRQKKTREYLINQCQAKKVLIIWEVTDKPNGEVLVYARTTEDLTFGLAVLKSCIVEHVLDIPDEIKTCLRQPYWSHLKESMLKDNDGQLLINVAEDTSSITVAANHHIINGVLEQINTYTTTNTVFEKYFNMERGTVLLLQREKSQDLRKIEQDLSVKLRPSDIHGKPGYMIEGIRGDLSRALTRLTALAGTIVTSDHKMKRPRMTHFLGRREVVTSLESRYRVVIIIDDEEKQPVETETTQHTAAAKKPIIKATAILGRGRKLLLMQGDITAYGVDASVNRKLQHTKGVARAIVDKGRMKLQQECNDFMSVKRGPFCGEMYTPQVDRLPNRKGIHRVRSMWLKDETIYLPQYRHTKEENELYKSVYACLEEASVLRFRTVAFPAISSGVDAFRKNSCCEVILTAIRDYFNKVSSSSLQEIYLVDNNPSLVTSLHMTARGVFGKANVILAANEQDTQSLPAGHLQGKFPRAMPMYGWDHLLGDQNEYRDLDSGHNRQYAIGIQPSTYVEESILHIFGFSHEAIDQVKKQIEKY